MGTKIFLAIWPFLCVAGGGGGGVLWWSFMQNACKHPVKSQPRRKTRRTERCDLNADFLFIKRQQQQNNPARQKANILQQKHQPGPLVVDVNQGGELRRERGEAELKMCISSVSTLYCLDVSKANPQQSIPAKLLHANTHHICQTHI